MGLPRLTIQAGADARAVQNQWPTAIEAAQAAAAAEAAARASADSTEAAARTALATTVAAQRFEWTSADGRPGDKPHAFTFVSALTSLIGEAKSLPVVDEAKCVFGVGGGALRIIGAGILAAREAEPIEAGRIRAPRCIVRRNNNASDPLNDLVRFGVVWLDQAKNYLSFSTIADFDTLTTGSGLAAGVGYVAAAAGTGVTFVAPMGAVYFRRFIYNFGLDGVTDVIALASSDITGLSIPPDITSGALADIAGLQAIDAGTRLTALETGLPDQRTYKSKSDAQSATVGATVTTITLLGETTEGDGEGYAAIKVVSIAGGARGFTTTDGYHFQEVATTVDVTTITDRAARGFSFYVGLGTAYVKKPSGDAASDVAAMTAAQARATRYIELQAGTYKRTAAALALASNQDWIGHGRGQTIIKADTLPTTHMVTGSSLSHFALRGLSFDFNSDGTATVGETHRCVFSLVSCDNFSIEDFEVLNINRFGIAVDNVNEFRVGRGKITRATPSYLQNEAINISTATGFCSGIRLFDIEAIKCAYFISGDHTLVERCTVDGWGFGGGFCDDTGDLTTRSRYVECRASNADLPADENGVFCCGFENYAFEAQLLACEAYRCSDAGFVGGAQAAKYIGCTAISNGQSTGAPGFTIRSPSNNAVNHADFSRYIGCSAYDDQVSKTQSYGYGYDGGTGLTHIDFAGSRAWANATGDFNMPFPGNTFAPHRYFEVGVGSITVAALSGGSPGAVQSTATVPFARVGMTYHVAFSGAPGPVKIWAWSDTINSITVRYENATGSPVTLAAGTLRFYVIGDTTAP